jgi:subtilisin family serine protease
MGKGIWLLLITVACLVACQPSTPITFPKIDRYPDPENWNRDALTDLPTFDPASTEPFQVDLRGYDLSGMDLSALSEDLSQADFDTQTIWPPADQMPSGFDPQQIMELGKNPGLGVRQLHARGITGRGVGIAIIDGPLLVDHQEYADQVRLYEETDELGWRHARMHGVAVSSFAVGKTVGVAPEADLYYIATTMGIGEDFGYLARAIRRILEVNEQLPNKRQIRVIATAIGWGSDSRGYEEIAAAAKEASAAGLLVVCSSMEQVHGFKFHGLGRHPLADPDAFESYEPGIWWAERFYAGDRFPDRLLVPMDSRTASSDGGVDEYVFYRQGGWSWSIPYIAGIYALAAQVDPAITPQRFWTLALETGRTIEIEHGDQAIALGPIIDPAALVDALQRP